MDEETDKKQDDRLLRLELERKSDKKSHAEEIKELKDSLKSVKESFNKIHGLLIGENLDDSSFKSTIEKIKADMTVLVGELKLVKSELKDLPLIKKICYGLIGLSMVCGAYLAQTRLLEKLN